MDVEISTLVLSEIHANPNFSMTFLLGCKVSRTTFGHMALNRLGVRWTSILAIYEGRSYTDVAFVK